jgi:hypothetical protein
MLCQLLGRFDAAVTAAEDAIFFLWKLEFS